MLTIMNNERTDRHTARFGPWLRDQLRARRLNQTEFARRLGVPQGTVSRWVNGRVPEASYIDGIADVLVLDYDIVATKAGYRPRELLEIDPDSATARLMPLIEQIDWGSRPGRLEALEFELRNMIEWDRMQKSTAKDDQQ